MIAIHSILGWLGMILLILGYLMISFKKIRTKSKRFHLINLVGSVFLFTDAIYSLNFPVIVLNFFWAVISIVALVKLFKIKPVYKELS